MIFTEHAHDASGRDRGLMWDVPLNRPIKEGALRIGAEDTPTYHEIAPEPGEKIIQKHRYSAFFDTDLHTYLRGCDVDTVIITGCMTNYCCGATARDAFFRDYKVIFGSDLNATDNQEVHEAELKTLRRGYARVIPLDEILKELVPGVTGATRHSHHLSEPVSSRHPQRVRCVGPWFHGRRGCARRSYTNKCNRVLDH